MFQPQAAPVAHSILDSGLVGLLPLVSLFVLLGALRIKAHIAGISALAVAIVVSVIGFHMPLHLSLLSASEGAVFGLFPIMWIVINAVWLYQITVISGRFEDLRRAFRVVSDDPRVLAVIIAFCFGGLLEALAGFGAPVAITGVMLMALGFPAMRAATVVLLANTAPVAYGAIATPIITAGTLTGIPHTEIGAYVGRQTPVLAMIVPLMLLILVDGSRGLRQAWPLGLVVGFSFGAAQFVSANYVSVELTDVIASLVALIAAVALLRVWRPVGPEAAAGPGRGPRAPAVWQPPPEDTGPFPIPGPVAVATARPMLRPRPAIRPYRVWMAFLPYLIVVAVFALANLFTPLKHVLVGRDLKVHWPGLYGQVLSRSGKPAGSAVYTFPWLSSPGTLLLLCGILVALLYRVPFGAAWREFGSVLVRMRVALLTVASVLALAYVMNLSGQTITVGTWIAGVGSSFAFFAPILGWLGTALTGSDTSANALFATLQQTIGKQTGINPTLLVSANTAGGVLGKMISPQNLTIAATAVGLAGKESELLRRTILWSLGLLLVVCVLVFLQSTVLLSWTLP